MSPKALETCERALRGQEKDSPFALVAQLLELPDIFSVFSLVLSLFKDLFDFIELLIDPLSLLPLPSALDEAAH